MLLVWRTESNMPPGVWQCVKYPHTIKKFAQPSKYISHVEMRKPDMKLLRNIYYKMFKQNEGTCHSYLWLSSYVSRLFMYLCIYFSLRASLFSARPVCSSFPKFSSCRILHFSSSLLLLTLHISKMYSIYVFHYMSLWLSAWVGRFSHTYVNSHVSFLSRLYITVGGRSY